MIDYGQQQKDVTLLPSLDSSRYENIFNIYKTDDGDSYYYYNILNKIVLPDPIDETIVTSISLNRSLPWTTLAYRLYGDISLWWLIVLLNKPKNIFYAESGIEYRYIIQESIPAILNSIQQQINV
jgi:hypothetical protein